MSIIGSVYMIMQSVVPHKGDCTGGQSRLLTWIDALEPNSPEVLKSHSDWRKRPFAEPRSIGSQPKRRANTRLRKRGPLALATGNIMSLPIEEAQTPRSSQARRSPRKEQPSTPHTTKNHEQQEAEELNQKTPKAQDPMRNGGQISGSGLPITVRLPPPIYGKQTDKTRAASPSRDSGSSSAQSEALSSARSTSPTKQLADLRMAERPTTYEALDGKAAESAGGVLDKYKDLVEASRGVGVIPSSIKSLVQRMLHEVDWPPAYAYKSSETIEYDQSFYQRVLSIHRAAERCEKLGLSEAQWNGTVHQPIYDLVVEHPKYNAAMGCMNITTARVQPKSLWMTHASGMKMSSKMVDFAIYIQPDLKMERDIRNTLRSELKEAQSINQTMYGPLRMCPISISVETKLPFSGGETADIQLATWAGAGLTRLRQMLPPDEKIPTIPTLSAHGHDLHLVAFQEQADHNVMYGKLRLGSTDTLLGTFQMLKSLDILVDWASTEYRSWYFDKVVVSD